MKKLVLVIFLFFALQLNAYAKTGISFIYINGSNIYNEKINKWYKKGIRKFHPCLKDAFEQNPITQECFLKNGEYFIEETPVTFYWGDKNYNSEKLKRKNLTVSKGFITWLACRIRLITNNVLHDVVWIQQYHNMNLVLDDLHKTVCAEIQKGNKVVLYGYSSGSFVAYEYLLSRIRYINVADFFNSINISKEQKFFVSQHPMKNTCMSALVQKLAVFSADGHIILDSDIDSFKKNYVDLNEQTEAVCSPNNAVIGVVNIASPLALFNWNVPSSDFQLTYYNGLLYKYIFENDMFWITVNYREDPMSFSSRRNLTAGEIENITNLSIEPNSGFIYDQSTNRGGISAITHMAYLSTQKKLSKSIVKAYINGYRNQYDCYCKKNTCNKCHEKCIVRP